LFILLTADHHCLNVHSFHYYGNISSFDAVKTYSKNLYKNHHKDIYIMLDGIGVRVIMLNATFNNISVISWRSVLLVDETGENHRSVASQ
jgi:tRNA A37 threonylcarbamoyladenosine biosynthesis protein TsaE